MLRSFTVAEANALVPWLQERFAIVRGQASELVALKAQASVRATRKAYGQAGSVETVSLGGTALERVTELEGSIRAEVGAITELGIEVRRVDGLVDFPGWVDGQLVYLCWRAGELAVGFWHPTDAGFDGRRPLRDPPPLAN